MECYTVPSRTLKTRLLGEGAGGGAKFPAMVRERRGLWVEYSTPERVILGSIPTSLSNILEAFNRTG